MIQSKSRLFAIVLLGSLALNFFLCGLLVGKHFGHFAGPDTFHPPPMGPRIHWLIESLPAESQEKVRPLLQTHRQNMRSQMRQIRQARRAVHQQLIASEFEPQALSEALTASHQIMAQARGKMHTLLVEIATQLDEEDRHRLAAAIRKKPPRHKDHFRGPPSDR